MLLGMGCSQGWASPACMRAAQGRYLLEQRASHDHDTSGAIANLVVLALGQLHQQAPYLVLHLHLL